MRCDGQRARNRHGWSLIALIVILAVALSVLTGLSVAVAENLQLGAVRANEAKALYLANAGIMDAIASYQPSHPPGNDWFELGCFGSAPACDNSPNLNLGPREVFVRQTTDPQRDFLLADMTSARIKRIGGGGGGPRPSFFDRWELQRVASNKTLTIDAMIVRWTDAVASEYVTSLQVAGQTTSGLSVQAGLPIVLNAPVTLANNAWQSDNRVDFNVDLSSRSNLIIVLTFLMSDRVGCVETPGLPVIPANPTTANLPLIRAVQLRETCQRTTVWWNGNNQENWGLFTVRATGEVRASPFMGRRRLRAEYRARAAVGPKRNQIISWREE